jgi:hypothetical protein
MTRTTTLKQIGKNLPIQSKQRRPTLRLTAGQGQNLKAYLSVASGRAILESTSYLGYTHYTYHVAGTHAFIKRTC